MNRHVASLNEVKELMRNLIRIDSHNPPGSTAEIAEFIANYLERIGLCVDLVSRVKRKVNVVATIKGKEERPTLIFNSHLDTVPTGNPKIWTFDPLEGEITGGKIYGRGSSDCKAGIASMMLAAKHAVQSDKKLCNITFHMVCDEETGGENGTKYLLKKGYADRAIAAISGEPSFYYSDGIRLELAAKGLVWLKIRTYGKAVHGSVPKLGVNAIEKMAKIVLTVQNMQLPEIWHKYLGSPTVSVGTIKGGVKFNIVPDYCSVDVDRRILPQENPKEVFKQVKLVLEELKISDRDLKADCELINTWYPSETSENEHVVHVVKRVCKRLLGKTPTISGRLGATDMWLYRLKGIPTLHYGPGVAANAHKINEFAELQPIIEASDVYAELIFEFSN